MERGQQSAIDSGLLRRAGFQSRIGGDGLVDGRLRDQPLAREALAHGQAEHESEYAGENGLADRAPPKSSWMWPWPRDLPWGTTACATTIVEETMMPKPAPVAPATTWNMTIGVARAGKEQHGVDEGLHRDDRDCQMLEAETAHEHRHEEADTHPQQRARRDAQA